MSNDKILVIELPDHITGKITKLYMDWEEWKFYNEKQYRPKLQGEGLMFHPDRSHETPEFKQAVINSIRGFEPGNIDVKNYKEFREAQERKMWYPKTQEESFKLNTQKMKNPKQLVLVKAELTPGNMNLVSIGVPTYVLGEDGMKDGEGITITFCKGTKETPVQYRQEGVFTESLIQASLEYLQDVNTGTLQNIDTTEAIQHLKAALACLDRRQQKRINNGTIYTSK